MWHNIKQNKYYIIAIIVIFLLYKLYKRFFSSDPIKPYEEVNNNAVKAKVTKDAKKQATALQHYLKNTAYDSTDYKNFASEIATALGTNKNQSWIDRYGVEDEERVLDVISLNNKMSMVFVKKFYKEDATNGNDLTSDLQKYLSQSEYDKVKAKL